MFPLFRELLSTSRLQRVRGIVNSPINLILTEMEHGNSIEAAVGKAPDLGITAAAPASKWTAGTER